MRRGMRGGVEKCVEVWEEVRGDVGKGEVREEMWESVLGPHTQTHFPTPPPFLSPHPVPTCEHTSPLTPYTQPHPSPHFSTPHTSLLTPQHTSLHLPPHPPYLFPQLPSPPPTPQHTSPLTPCTLPHLSPQFRRSYPCDDVLLINLTEKVR